MDLLVAVLIMEVRLWLTAGCALALAFSFTPRMLIDGRSVGVTYRGMRDRGSPALADLYLLGIAAFMIVAMPYLAMRGLRRKP